MSYTNRSRSLVKRAAKDSDVAHVKEWLSSDERGVWEKEARRLLAYLAEAHPSLSEAEADDAVVAKLCLSALETVHHAALKDP